MVVALLTLLPQRRRGGAQPGQFVGAVSETASADILRARAVIALLIVCCVSAAVAV